MKSTKKALISAIIAVVICCTMFVGSTFAWFTDQAESKGNKIVAGTFEMDLGVDSDGDGHYESIKNSSDPLFTEALDGQWEPGKTAVRYLAIANKGSLDMKYTVSVTVKETDGKDMYKVMQYDIIPDATYGQAENWLNDGTHISLGENVVSEATNVVIEGETRHEFALAIHMDEEAGLIYAEGVVEFDIKVIAGQLSDVAPMGNEGVTQTIKSETVAPGATATASNNDGSFKIEGTAGETGEITAKITPINSTDAVFSAAAPYGKSVVSYDVSVEGHEPGSIVKAEIFLGKNLVDVAMYHNGVRMTYSDSKQRDTYTYDSATGYVTIYVDSFSPFEAAFFFYDSDDLPLAKVTTMDPQKISTTIGMGGAAQEMNLDAGYIFTATETEEQAAASKYAYYHADYVISVDRAIAPEAAALVGYYEAYCKDYNDNNWVALMSSEVLPANTEIRLIELLLNGGSINYAELCEWIKEFKCGVSMLDESVIGTTLTVELRLYELKDNKNSASVEDETGEYVRVCKYTYTFQ